VKGNAGQDSGHRAAGPPAIRAIHQATQEKLAKLGIADEFDLMLHLPLRYDDETHLYPIGDVPLNKAVQVEGNITHSEILFRPRRQLVCQVEDGSGSLFMRFLNFYGSQVKAYSKGVRVRLLGEIRSGFFGVEMVHPKCRVIHKHTPLPETLTPVYHPRRASPPKPCED